MTPLTCMAGKTVALFGLGGSGLATAAALLAGGASVYCWDDNEKSRERAAGTGLTVVDLVAAEWRSFDALVLAPGVPLTHPAPHWTVTRARAAGVEVIGDVELFCRERAAMAPDAPFIAITGTNGKSTTTALIAHIIYEAGADVQLGGNIGTPILALEPPSNERFHVVELSSFQIDLAPSLNPTVGVLLNLSPDHIDRHGSMELYAAVKERLIDGADTAIVGVDDRLSWDIGQRRRHSRSWGASRVIPVSSARSLARGVYADGSRIVSTVADGAPRALCDLAGVAPLRGAHNAQNAAAAAACVDLWEFPAGVIAQGMRSFPGLPHRLEEVGRAGSVVFINDSKATNADAAARALQSFDEIYWIAGGRAKDGGAYSLRPLMSHVRKAYLIGEAAGSFAATLDGYTDTHVCATLERAVEEAYREARQSDAPEVAVLLSPACASYDQFTDYEARGDTFRELVQALPGVDSPQQ
ncbi:MAG: UDP-N-acetylmuramoyl-L-alanine--D-glutamate ligase [Hyphomicrobiales bacterium]|nr:UDP-N-acetylmuramoyl-L-alanine--D-glutamate ligase [Hyphomicrobiales bacterium]